MLLQCLGATCTIILGAALAANAAMSGTAEDAAFAGRWEGTIETPGAPIAVVLDIAKSNEGGWRGSAIFPAFGVKGAPLKELSVAGPAIAFAVKNAMGEPKIAAQLTADGTLAGKCEQGGHTLHLALKKTGAAQVDLPPLGTPIGKDLEGEWHGMFEIGSFKMRLGLKLANEEKGPATGQLILLDSGNHSEPVELITQTGDNLELSVPGVNFGYEGRFDKAGGELKGVLRVSSIEIPLVWHRATK